MCFLKIDCSSWFRSGCFDGGLAPTTGGAGEQDNDGAGFALVEAEAEEEEDEEEDEEDEAFAQGFFANLHHLRIEMWIMLPRWSFYRPQNRVKLSQKEPLFWDENRHLILHFDFFLGYTFWDG